MRTIQSSRTFLALCVNAVMLLLILLAISSGNTAWFRQSAAYGQFERSHQYLPSDAGPTVMPGQLSPNTWGCYVLDPQFQTLCVYEYSRGEHNLHLAASRDIEFDRRLTNFNTTPTPLEIKQMLDRAEEPARAVPPVVKSPEATNP